MGNHTVKKEKSNPAGLTDKTIIVGMQINQEVKKIGEKAENEAKEGYNLEAKGKLQRAVVPEEYVVIKAYPNKTVNKDKKNQEDDRDSK